GRKDILDPEMSELLRRHFETKGVRVMLNTRGTGFEGDGKIRRVVTEDGNYPADMAIMGVGVRPNVKLASDAGLELGETGAIKVDDGMCTSDPAIFAAGDCVEARNLLNNEPAYVPRGSTANKQGRVAAINICGGEESFPGITGTTVCKVFDYTVARAGLTEKEARDQRHDLVIAITPGLDRAHFMPHAAMIITKLIVDCKSKELIGIQIVGPGEAAKRVDVAVAAMTGKLDIDSISKLDLCYAPSYSEALDNLHTACNVAKNKLEGYMAGISACKVKEKLERGEDIMLLDVRSHGELNEASIDGSTHIPLAALRGRLGELPREKEIIVFSGVSLSAYEAAIILQANGFENVKVMDGGIIMWPHCTDEP
ncbi:MAG: FAD-dependent oxidoreductase, partial [Planctomycetes bacterium]|nr:FAD-dependent oxidoreductase [Planctomycetota bacterium]